MPLSRGTHLGPYKILEPLGAGGMGEVYRARDTRLGRDVAVKVMPQHVAPSPEERARFQREAKAISALNHPHICVLHDVGQEGETEYLVMEYVEGETLAHRLSSGALPTVDVLRLGAQIADALAQAHRAGIIHRDLKPGNVMLTKSGVKLMDFGLARVAPRGEADGVTVTAPGQEPITAKGALVGTFQYMAPEQLEGKGADARSDIWALGCVLYEMATGCRAFEGTTTASVISAIMRDQPRMMAEITPMAPPALERVVMTCLQKDPTDRVQTAHDLKLELEWIAADDSRPRPVVARRGSRRTIAWVLAGLAAVFAAGLTMVLLRPGPEQTPGMLRSERGPNRVATIAVLPFVNRSASPDDEYFSDGLAEELLNVLAKIEGLRVSARSSSFSFKGKDATIAEVGKSLNVATVLEGSVRKAGNRIRVSVQLVKVSGAYPLWSETYDRTLDDIFAVQDDIALAVVKELRATLLGMDRGSDASGQAKADVASAATGRSTNPEAQRLYFLSRHLLRQYTREGMAKGIGYLNDALALDPEYALAWAQLSIAYSNEAIQGWVPVAEGYARSRAAARRAVSLDPNLAEAHAALAVRRIADWDWVGAEASIRRALELAPSRPTALSAAGDLAQINGRVEEALGFYRRSAESDPLNPPAYSRVGRCLLIEGRFVDAEKMYRRALELAPQRIVDRSNVAFAVLAQGRGKEALAEAMREPDEGFRLAALAMIHHRLGNRLQSGEALRELAEKHAEDYAYQIAEVHATRGEVDAAFQWLEKAYAQRDGGLTDLMLEPDFRSLHGDPRWGALLKKMGFKG